MNVGLRATAEGALGLPAAALPGAAYISSSTDVIATCICHCITWRLHRQQRDIYFPCSAAWGTFQEALPAGLAAAVLRLLPPLAMLFTGELAAAGSGGGGFTGGSTKPASSMLRAGQRAGWRCSPLQKPDGTLHNGMSKTWHAVPCDMLTLPMS